MYFCVTYCDSLQGERCMGNVYCTCLKGFYTAVLLVRWYNVFTISHCNTIAQETLFTCLFKMDTCRLYGMLGNLIDFIFFIQKITNMWLHQRHTVHKCRLTYL